MLACSQNRDAAGLIGINVDRVTQLSFLISAALGAIAGMISTPLIFITYDRGLMIAIKGFVAATLGGIENPLGGAVAGILLGLSK